MKQTISTINPPPPPTVINNNNNTCKKKPPQTLNWFQRGSQAGPQPHPSRLPFFLFCYATSKTFFWRGGGCPTMCAGWDRVCPCLVPSSSSFALIRFLRFCKILVRKMQQNIPYDALSCMDPEILSDKVQLNSDTLFLDEWSEELKYH